VIVQPLCKKVTILWGSIQILFKLLSSCSCLRLNLQICSFAWQFLKNGPLILTHIYQNKVNNTPKHVMFGLRIYWKTYFGVMLYQRYSRPTCCSLVLGVGVLIMGVAFIRGKESLWQVMVKKSINWPHNESETNEQIPTIF
jgi:hypothetical protein